MNVTIHNEAELRRPVKSYQLRLRLLQVVLFVVFIVICLRLVQVQIIENNKYRKIVEAQSRAKIPLPPNRGVIRDRTGSVLASNSEYVSFAADPRALGDSARLVAVKFARTFGKSVSYYVEKLASDKQFVWLERQVTLNDLKRLDTSKIRGVITVPEPRRLYYYGHLAGPLLGSTDIDNKGLTGLELEFDKVLRGDSGWVVFMRDARGRQWPMADYPRKEPVDGHNIQLTIDMKIQEIAETELKAGVEKYGAEHGTAVILRPDSGQILAIAQYPSVDPNDFRNSKEEDRNLRAVSEVFEPGSVFKVVTASAALEAGEVTPQTKIDAENGVYTVPVSNRRNAYIRDTHKEGVISFERAMWLSSNIVMAKVGQLVGPERFYRMARDYGFGNATNIEFPGEAKGKLKKPSEWSGTTLKWLAHGYEVGVTAMQIAAAYSAVANDGVLMQPYLLMRETDATGNVLRENHPRPIRRVLSLGTTRVLKEMFKGVVDSGTGQSAGIQGMAIAGKTGTSKKNVEGRYENDYTASFVGFFPVEKPRFLCLVMMDHLRGETYYGGVVSAPIFRAIAERVMRTSDLFGPSLLPGAAPAQPDTSALHEKAGTRKPPQGKKKVPPARSAAYAAKGVPAGIVPDVKGCSLKQAIRILAQRKYRPLVKGSGTVVAQRPEAGQPARSGMNITLECRPRRADDADTR